MAADVLITFLPGEVIEYILEDANICIPDVVRFALTCKQLHRVVTTSNKLWRTKFFQRWPYLREIYEINEKAGIKIQNWFEEVQASSEARKKLLYHLSQMSAKNYKKQELSHSELKDFDPLFRPEEGAHPLAYHFLVDELITLIKRPAITSNLTHKYYAYKVVRYLRQHYLTQEWKKFIALPPNEQILERGAALVAQWSQTERRVPYSYIAALLDDIAEQTKDLLREQHPTHPIFSVSDSKFELWKRSNIDDNQWSNSETRRVMSALCEVMFNRLGFHGNSEMYYSSENSYIDRVLELRRGIPITLAIVFESVARRLGVRCEPVSFPAHFLLRWKERYNVPDSEDVESFYIDVFNGGQFLTKNNCPRVGGVAKCPIERYNVHSAATTVEVVERMADNLEVAGRQRTQLNGRAARLRSALELLHMVRPHDTSTILHMARFYILHQMDLAELVTILNDIQKDLEVTSRGQANHILQMLQDYEKHMQDVPEENFEPKRRTGDVKYAIGLIMRHRTYGYLCVITGWDPYCTASSEWMTEMGVEELAGGPNQPFYNVFADDGSSRYAAQGNLLMAPSPEWVNHYEIGRFFCKFNGTHYVPNEEKAREYPEDAEVRNHLLATYL
ncbi:F-box only protein 21 [Cephus cinctus]|uniref:F-box only protein 21 n=1 Tax=Cephus cinctus TaxID=211228 RepID=A0AAJ7RTL5_CEPCN|nr:F-box only protein 21 [Cephus cinctus]XP_024946352.1 F-box only protein 21 [Cephus cinctus]